MRGRVSVSLYIFVAAFLYWTASPAASQEFVTSQAVCDMACPTGYVPARIECPASCTTVNFPCTCDCYAHGFTSASCRATCDNGDFTLDYCRRDIGIGDILPP